MIGSRAWFALMRRNFVYRKRFLIGTILELLLPMAGIFILVGIKKATESGGGLKSDTINATFPTNDDTWSPLTFNDYLTALQAKRICIPEIELINTLNKTINGVIDDTTGGGFGSFGAGAGAGSPPTDNGFGGNMTGTSTTSTSTSSSSNPFINSTFGNSNSTTVFTSAANVTDEQDLMKMFAQNLLDEMINDQVGYYISGYNYLGDNWQVPLIKCDSRACKSPGQDASKTLCEYNVIGVSGNTERVTAFITWMETKYPLLKDPTKLPFNYNLIKNFASSADMDTYVQAETYGQYPQYPKIAMGIIFNGNDPNVYDYTLRQNSTNFNSPEKEGRPATIMTPDTDVNLDDFTKNDDESCIPIGGAPDQGTYGSSCTGQYMYNGILTFQRLVNDFIIDATGASTVTSMTEGGVQFVPFPTRSYKDAGFYAIIGQFAPILITLGLLYPVAFMSSYIAQEKELRQKELMKMMSVTESDIGWSWFMTFFLLHVVTSALVALASDILFDMSEFVPLFIFWLLSFTSVIVFCMMIGALSSKSIRAVLLSVITFFAGAVLALIFPLSSVSGGTIALISLHPVTAFSYGIAQIGQLEDQGVGLTFDTFNISSGNKSGYSVFNSIGSLIVNSILWGVVTWYLNRVIKPDYGQAYPFYFPFMPSYWFPQTVKNTVSDTEDAGLIHAESGSNVPYEPVGETLRRQAAEGQSIEIHELRKQFGEKTAVDGLSLSMYAGQITALLGHNGAGKTTTIAMLTGAIAPTSGYAKVAGKDIRSQMSSIRQDIGICLQHDCLFPMLTVREHVQFFARLKGLYSKVSFEEAEDQIDQAIRDVALFEKRNTYSKSLSGGMKRKLSVAIAFSGGSKVVILDEPTSGMDPFSRRFTWNVIRQYRKDRCIILTTHFMDEADILGDRIAIMAEGQLRCAGSSLFLKKTYGVGYQLTIEKTSTQLQNNDIENELFDDEGNVVVDDDVDDRLRTIVKTNVKEALLLNSTGTEVRYQLPIAAASNFPPMFDGLDTENDRGRIQSYGVSMTTLDEVFLLVARGDHTTSEKPMLASSRKNLVEIEQARADEESASVTKSERSHKSRMDLSKDGLFLRHVSALTKKRAANFSRDKKAWVCTTLGPTVAVLLGLVLVTFSSVQRNLDPITLNLATLNADVTSDPKIPLFYNTPDTAFDCLPGSCSYTTPIILVNETQEVYTYCGYSARMLNDMTAPPLTCSQSISTGVMDSFDSRASIKGSTGLTNIENSSQSLYSTADTFAASQYGAILFTHDRGSFINSTNTSYNDMLVASCQSASSFLNYSDASQCAKLFGGVGYVIQYNFTALHIAPMMQALADEAIIRQATNNDQFQIKVTIAPLPITSFEESLGQADDALILFFLVVLSLPIISGTFGAFIVTERESKAKHLQTVAGVEPIAYWLSSFLWDFINYQIPLWLTIGLFFAFDMEALTTSENDQLSAIIVTLLLYGSASTAFAYVLSFAFKSPSMITTISIISGFLIGLGGPLAAFIMTLIGLDPTNPNENLIDIADAIVWILRITPPFCLGKSIFYILNLGTIEAIKGKKLSAWSEPVALYEIYFLAGQTIVYLILAIQLDKWSTNPSVVSVWKQFTSIVTCSWLCSGSKDGDIIYSSPDDSDVVNEAERVSAGGANSDLIVLSQLTKVYDNGKKAVNNVSLGIPPGQCFGLLGINGAGKTTTMGILTAEFPPSSGDATLAGYSVMREPQKTRRRIGYCPQFDAHFANMTGREHVELYASIKGVPVSAVKEAASEKLMEVGLSDFDSDRLCSNYSGGMKRRLSLAIATIGSPQIVFLDECSTGVDPVARREIWELVSAMVSDENVAPEERTSVILTTHSMEECEALCPRIGIMANGKLRCLGSAQHLKTKFGQGYQLELKTALASIDDEDYVEVLSTLLGSKGLPDTSSTDDVTFKLSEAKAALGLVSNDDYLSDMVSSEDPIGYNVWRDAESLIEVTLDALAAFATNESRMRNVESFLADQYNGHVLRERQDTKARYEISAQGTRISDIFSSVEANKVRLYLDDYGVSQTSLEQVFNMHAAEAEKLKQGRNDT